ncbi:MAG: hypothetical protein QOC71_193, partial [Thermoplasmata archaeon]|nr:hypothetical protein [Thermoplasmata archaeon]
MRGRSGGEAFGRTPRLPSLLAVLLLLPLLPMVSAQEPPPEHQVTVIGSSMSLFQEPGLETMIENDQVDTDCTGARTLTRDLVNRTFTFRDPFQDTDCTEAQFVMRIPVGATSLVVNFTADRQIGQAESAVPGVQGLPLVPNMVEQFRLRGPDGVIGFADLFDKQDAPSPPVTFTLEYSFPLGLQTVTLGWFFKDEGATFQEQPLRAGQVFNATVTNMTVTWPALPLLEPTILVGPEEIREEDRVAVAHVYTNVTLPDLAPLIVGKTAGLRLTVAAGPDLVGLLGPRGPMDVEGLSSVEGGRRLELSLNGTVLAEQGFGTYTFDFLTARTLAPLPPVSAPSRVYPMFWALLLLPIPAAVLATYSSNAYRREAEGPYLRTARAVLGAIVAIVVYYVAIALYALISIGQRE